MKIWFKRIVLGLVAALIATLVGVAIFLLTFDPNAYKSRLEELVRDRYQRTLAIRGDIELSLFPRIGLAVQDVSLSDRDSAAIFASIDSARFAVAIWPLLFNRLVVDHVAVAGFKAWLQRDANGEFNFQDLVARQASAGTPPVTATPAVGSSAGAWASAGAAPGAASGAGARAGSGGFIATVQAAGTAPGGGPGTGPAGRADLQIDIAGLELKGGEIHVQDRRSGSVARIVQLEASTGRMTYDQAFDVSMKGRLLGDQPQADAMLEAQALVRLDPGARQYSVQRLNLQAVGQMGDVRMRSAGLRGDLAWNAFNRMVSVGNLELQLQGELQTPTPLTDLEASLTVPRLRLDRSQAELQLRRLALRVKGRQADAPVDFALDAPALSVSPGDASGEAIVATFKRTRRDDVLGLSMQMSGLGGDAFDLTLGEFRLDSVHKQADRVVNVQMSSPAVWSPFARRGGLSAMKGDVRIEDVALPGGSFRFPFGGTLEADLVREQLHSSVNAVFSGNTLDFSLAARQFDDLHAEFDLRADRINLNTLFPATSLQEDDAEEDEDATAPAPERRPEQGGIEVSPRALDWSFLDTMHVQGKIAIDALQVGQLELDRLAAGVDASDGLLHIHDIRAGLGDGTVQGALRIAASQNASLELIVDDADVGALASVLLDERRLGGRGDVRARLVSHGSTVPALVANLTGSVQAHLRDGVWRGFDLGGAVSEANEVLRNVFSGQLPAVTTRQDSTRRTRFDTADADISFERGQGHFRSLELKGDRLHVQGGEPASLDLVTRQMDVLLGVTAQSATGDDGDPAGGELAGVTVPLRVAGTIARPSYRIQWRDIRHPVVKEAIQDGLLELLTYGSGGSALLIPPATEGAASGPEILKNLGNLLRGLLGQ